MNPNLAAWLTALCYLAFLGLAAYFSYSTCYWHP